MKRAILMLMLASCSVEVSWREEAMKTHEQNARKWCADMRLTPLSVVCPEFNGSRPEQCDVRVLETAMPIALACRADACNLATPK